MAEIADLTRHILVAARRRAHPRTTTRPRIRATDRGTQRTPRGNAPAPGRRRAFLGDDDFPLAREHNYCRALLAARASARRGAVGGAPAPARASTGARARPSARPDVCQVILPVRV